MLDKETVMEQLTREAGYARRSMSRDLLMEVYGKAKMALQLGEISHQEFMAVNKMTIYFINTHMRELLV